MLTKLYYDYICPGIAYDWFLILAGLLGAIS